MIERVRALLLRRPALSAALLTLVWSAAPLLLGLVYVGLDHTRVLLPMLCAHRGADGFVLDAALGGGGPALEDPLGLGLSPLAHLLRVIPVEHAASLYSVVNLVTGAAAAACLARSFGARRRAALLMGLAWPLCGTTVNLIIHAQYVVDAAALPWCWAAARACLRGVRAGPLSLATGIAWAALGGELQGVVLCVGFLLVEGLAALGQNRRRARSALPGIGAGLGVGALSVAAVVALSWGVRSAAARVDGVEAGVRDAWALAVPEAFGVLWPNVVNTRTTEGATLSTAWAQQALHEPSWNETPYLGLIVTAAALVGALTLRRRRTAGIVALLSLSLSLGPATPVYGLLLRLIPPLALFRYPAKYLVPLSLAAVLLAVLTLDAATRSARLRRRVLAALALLSAASVGALVWVAVNAGAIDAAAAAVATRPPRAFSPPLSTLLMTSGAAATLFALLALLTTVALAKAALPSRALLSLFLPLVFVLDLGNAAVSSLPTSDPILEGEVPQAPLPAGAVVCMGKHLGARRIDWPDRDLGIAGTIIVDVVDGKPNVGQCTGRAAPNTYLPSAQAASLALADALDERQGALAGARALGCTHLLTRATPLAAPGLTPLPKPSAPVAAQLYAIDDAVPDISVAPAPTLVDSGAAVAAVLRTSSAAEIVNILDDPAGSGVRELPTNPGATVEGGMTSTTRGRFRVSAGGGVVVFRRPWWPGFHATAETGRGLPVVRSAGALLAVVVDAEEAGRFVDVEYRVAGAVPAALLLLLFGAGLVPLALRARPLRRRGVSARA